MLSPLKNFLCTPPDFIVVILYFTINKFSYFINSVFTIFMFAIDRLGRLKSRHCNLNMFELVENKFFFLQIQALSTRNHHILICLKIHPYIIVLDFSVKKTPKDLKTIFVRHVKERRSSWFLILMDFWNLVCFGWVFVEFKGTVKEKWKGVRFWVIHIRHLSDVPVSRNWYKTCQNNTKSYIYQIPYKIRSI